MFCTNCGKEFDGKFCPECGTPVTTSSSTIINGNLDTNISSNTYYSRNHESSTTNKKQKEKKKGKPFGTFLIILGLFLALGSYLSNIDDSKTSEKAAKDTDKTDVVGSKKKANSKMQYEVLDVHFNYYTNNIGSREYFAFVEIENTGTTNIYLKECIFDLVDNDGHLLQSDSFISRCPDIIAPGEKGYFYNGLGSNIIDDGVSDANGIKFVPDYKVEEARDDITDYSISDLGLKKGTFGSPTITGRVENTTDKDISMLYVQAIFYAQDGSILAISGTNILDLTAGGKQSFELTTLFANDSVNMNSIASYKVIARKSYYQW